MPVIAKSSRRPAPILRRGLGLYFSGIIGLLIALGASWLATKSTPDRFESTLSGRQPARGLPTASVIRDLKMLPAAPNAVAANSKDPDALTAFFATTEATPRAAVELATHLMRADATTARDCGYALIFGLNRRDEFSTSANFAITAPAELRRDLLIAAYHDWGRRQPELALLSAAQITEVGTRQTALQSALSGWARTDPEGLADTAVNFPDGAEKFAALTKALRAWVIKDPSKAGDWIVAHRHAVSAAEAALRED